MLRVSGDVLIMLWVSGDVLNILVLLRMHSTC
jgi:hypothetical protein